MDYSAYEGRKLKVVFSGGEVEEAFVAGCDINVGLTVMLPWGMYVICLNGPSSPYYRASSIEKYEEHFHEVLEGVDAGIIDLVTLFEGEKTREEVLAEKALIEMRPAIWFLHKISRTLFDSGASCPFKA